MRILFLFLSLFTITHISMAQPQKQSQKPLRVGIARLTHSHVHGLLNRPKQQDLEIVGIYEPNKALAQRYAEQYGYSMDYRI